MTKHSEEFVEWIIEQHVDVNFSNKIIKHLDDFVNRQNCQIWGSEYSPDCRKTNSSTRSRAREAIELLHEAFACRILYRFGDKNWPTRLCNFTRLNFMGLFEVKRLCQPAHNHAFIAGGKLQQRNYTTLMRNGHEKFRQKNNTPPYRVNFTINKI